MDPSVYFALGTLTVVFLLSLFILIALCWRRRQQVSARRRADVNFRFSRLRDDKVDNLMELSPLLSTELDKLDWAEGVEGPFADVISILRLSTSVVKVLSKVNVSRVSPKIYDVIAQAMLRVDTHFHELLEFTPSTPEDLRVIEARALTLTTTVWALNAAFTVHGYEQAAEVEEMVIKMYEHVDALRQLIPGYVGRDEEEEEEEEGPLEKAAVGDEEESQATADSSAETVITFAPSPSAEVVADVAEASSDALSTEAAAAPAREKADAEDAAASAPAAAAVAADVHVDASPVLKSLSSAANGSPLADSAVSDGSQEGTVIESR